MEAIVFALMFGGLILGGIILVGMSVWLELLVLFSDGVQMVPLIGCILSIFGVSLIMTIVKVKKPNQNIATEILGLTIIFGLFEGSFFNSVADIGKEPLFFATVFSQPLKCFIGWLISLIVNYNLENNVDKFRVKLQNYYADVIEQLKDCKKLLSAVALKQAESEALIKLFAAMGYIKLRQDFLNKSKIENGLVLEKVRRMLSNTKLNIAVDNMTLQDVDNEIDKKLKEAEALYSTYQNSKYTAQDYHELKCEYIRCVKQ